MEQPLSPWKKSTTKTATKMKLMGVSGVERETTQSLVTREITNKLLLDAESHLDLPSGGAVARFCVTELLKFG